MEADARLEAGDMDGAAHWRLVLAAVRRMVEPGSGAALTLSRLLASSQAHSD